MTSNVKLTKNLTKHVPGEAEFWIFILGDMLVFALFFGIWSVQHMQQPELFQQGYAQMNHRFGLINTIALVTSSLFVALGLNNAKQERFAQAKQWFMYALLLGGLFIVVKFFEYREKILAGVDILNNDFFMYYFVFTGIHLIHVIVGIVALLLMIQRCTKPRVSIRDIPFLEGASVYWHMVDILWIVLFLLIYLI